MLGIGPHSSFVIIFQPKNMFHEKSSATAEGPYDTMLVERI